MSQQAICKHDDPKTWVTPFAFDVAPNILYMPLASPLKRGLAMIIDGLLVAVLAENAGWMFVFLVLATLFIQKQSKQVGRVFKWALYIVMLLGLVSAVIGYYNNIDEQVQDAGYQLQDQDSDQFPLITNSGNNQSIDTRVGEEVENNFNSVIDIVAYMPAIISATQCRDMSCAQSRIDDLDQALTESSFSQIEQQSIVTNVVNDLALTTLEKQQLLQKYTDDIEAKAPELPLTEPKSNDSDNASTSTKGTNTGTTERSLTAQIIELTKAEKQLAQLEQQNAELEPKFTDVNNADSQNDSDVDDQASSASPLAWIQGLLNDLGLGFGWAAFYFTVFTAWFDGQTLGKKLLGIRVIQLDGVKISLWAAFGRYGGYAAGFTTGLLGFLQIYWDANRQAIQDKISATVVIDIRKTKHQAAVEHQQSSEENVNLQLNNAADI
ncbi:RDD family protein [Shewanella sp. 10N.261.52.F9]|uniref:RDD family protein n=1 Tax=Shewanella sp. 10N.261.52.F9 TaxID=3229684 RepID=UPI0035524DF5